MPDVTVYWRPMCGYCETLKRQLERHEVAYADVNIWHDRSKADIVRGATGGDEIVPTVRVGDRFYVNPTVHEVLDALGSSA